MLSSQILFYKQGGCDTDGVSNLAQVIGKMKGEFAPNNSSADVYALHGSSRIPLYKLMSRIETQEGAKLAFFSGGNEGELCYLCFP